MITTLLDASVVICTRNRSDVFAQTCREVLRQELREGHWELLIVDNNSTDDTLEIAYALAAENPAMVRVHVEKRLGLSAARNSGIKHSSGSFVLFLDDDAIPDPGWLETMTRELSRNNVECVGGAVRPVFQGELPKWFLGRFLKYLSAWNPGDKRVLLEHPEYPRGTNMGFRREVFERVGGFFEGLGRSGRSLLSCEEIELCLRVARLGGDIVYTPGAAVDHFTDAGRISKQWLGSRFASQGRSEAIMNWRHGGYSGVFDGYRFQHRNFHDASRWRGEQETLFAACQRRSLRGYIRGMLEAPLRIARWQLPGSRNSAWSPTRQVSGSGLVQNDCQAK